MKLIVLGSLVVAGVASAQDSPPPTPVAVAAETRALVTLPAKGGAKLAVSTPAFKDGADIPFENTQYKENVFPGLTWSVGPAGTRSYAIIMQDVDGRMRGASNPILHWTMGNIAPTVTRLDAGMTTPPTGTVYGPNYRGANQPYLGPRTPAGPRHRYHFQVFALDTMLPPEAFASYDELTAAMKDHVLASGEVVGLGRIMPQGGY
ncbi:MAG: YbhB/YbcL family Raf kinase inhibitor-like protein [Gemmatimonadaceae bacterium]|nr:YbhB/YbcL family Raf kinase inhibitor-like protein [Gemmatimonadaceae bacterium]